MAEGAMLHISARVETRGFDQLLAAVKSGLDQGLELLADEVVKEAKASVEFNDRTGSLRKTIRKYRDKEFGTWYVRAGGTKRVYHAHFIEFGHALVTRDGRTVGHVPPHAFLGPAADKVLGRGQEVVARWIEERTAGIEVPIK